MILRSSGHKFYTVSIHIYSGTQFGYSTGLNSYTVRTQFELMGLNRALPNVPYFPVLSHFCSSLAKTSRNKHIERKKKKKIIIYLLICIVRHYASTTSVYIMSMIYLLKNNLLFYRICKKFQSRISTSSGSLLFFSIIFKNFLDYK